MRKNKLVHGVGFNNTVELVNINGKFIHSYLTWRSMLGRCYSHKTHNRQPTYIGCTVCDEWLYFSNFKKWYDNNYIEGYHLDKDILVEGNKIYSPDTCRFVPRYINNLLNDRMNARGDLPLGVHEQKPNILNCRITTTYQAQCSGTAKKVLTKTFKTIAEAVVWYSETKKRIVKEQAQRAFLANEIKSDVYLALTRREFNDK